MINQLASRYNVLTTLGVGGMGSVFLVDDTASGNRVALKVLSSLSDESGNGESVLRFKQEFRTMTRLRHPNTVEVYDYGQLPDGTPYFTMEVVPGKGLDEILPLSPEKVEDVLVQLCRALGFIHCQGLVHCDIKPENIRIKEDGTLKLMDFGLMEAAGTSGGSIKGTLAYMAPEVCRRGKIDQRADLYSVGALAYHLLSGSPPFGGDTPLAIIKAHLETLPDPLGASLDGIPPYLDRLILRLLSKDPFRRPPSTVSVLSEMGIDSIEERTVLFTSPFVGREKELGELLSLLNASVEEKKGRCVWVTGSPGIGKSRL
ncbi:MAG TPA: serine/threonine-protein kinase, partial [Chroococcales cyanobacterium]